MTGYRIPTATYRVQFSLKFRFSDARDLVPYLNELGMSELYVSPHFKARKGSSHGYDVADPQRVSSELGTEEEFEELTRKLKNYSMGLLLDIVPNHMAATHENPWWMDVLENGPSSEFAGYFDIEWHPATTKAAFLQENKVLLPVLADLYGNVLEKCELVLKLDESGFYIMYYDHKCPLDPKSYGLLVGQMGKELDNSSAGSVESLREISGILEEIERLPACMSLLLEAREERKLRGGKIKERLWQLYSGDAEARRALDDVMRRVNGTREAPGTVDELDRLLSVQSYRLAHWKMGREEINYRRFFDVNELVGLRVEIPRVFEDRHRLILQLVRDGKVSGLRVDHVDGLHDPLGYLQQLQRAVSPDAVSPAGQNIYLVVEKILGERESLPEDWPVSGTTGYDFLNAVNAIFIDPQNLPALEDAYARFTGSSISFSEVSYAGNKLVMEQLFAGEIHALSHHLGRIAAQHRNARDLPLSELGRLLIEVTARLPVYRTYMRDEKVAPRDRLFIERALELLRERTSKGSVSDAALAFFRQVIFLTPPDYALHLREEYLRFAMRWQQFTGPVMAKGLEDTAAYAHSSLISLSEVGGDPLREDLPLEVEAFHLFNQERQLHWPHSLNATSTHDTKRGEDVRARVNVLSELPDEWEAALRRWSRWNKPGRKTVANHAAPAPNEEVLLYQTMLGAWPLQAEEVPGFKDRVKGFLVKAAREAKLYTNWIDPDAEHEAALGSFVEKIFDTTGKNRFLSDFLRLQKKISFYGLFNSLSQVLLKVTSPGVPDFYQGGELWDFNLVDPDNRRPVDFSLRARLLEKMKHLDHKNPSSLVKEMLEQWPDGRVKIFVTWKALNFRRAQRELFEKGEYLPVNGSGASKENLCAFARCRGKQWILVVVPRFLALLVDPGQWPLGRDVWGAGKIVLPRHAPLCWQNVLTGELLTASSLRRGGASLPLAGIFSTFPVALLCSRSEEAVSNSTSDPQKRG